MHLLFAILLFGRPVASDSDTTVAATVAGSVITAQELLDSYETGPAFVRRYENPLRKHLEFMINERLLAKLADSLGYVRSEFVTERFTALQEDLAADELYKTEILSRAKLSERDISLAMQKGRMNVRYRWIFTPTKDRAQALWSNIKKRQSFDSLFHGQFDSTVSSANRSAETTLLKLERDNHDLAAGIAKLKNGETSAPLEGNDGYYIVRVDESWQNPVSTQTEQASLRDAAIRVGTEIKADALATEYVKGKMKLADPQLKAAGFNVLRAFLSEKGLSRDTRIKWSIPATFMTEAGPQPLSASSKFLSRTLVTFGHQALTVRDYLRWFDARQFQLKTHSLAAFNSGIKRTVWKMVQDRLLIDESYRNGLHLRENVQRESSKWQTKLLYLAARSQMLRSLSVDETALRKKYELQKMRYRELDGKLLSFEQAREAIRSEVVIERETQVLFRTLQALKNIYPVSINENGLDQLSASVKKDPRAIDVMFYKPGGTFPRVAYPTIDEAWSRMQ